MAKFEKHKDKICVYCERNIPSSFTIWHNMPQFSQASLLEENGTRIIDSLSIKEYIEELISLTKCLNRALVAQKTAENNRKKSIIKSFKKKSK